MKYKHLLFDLDYTLWDFSKNCRATLNQLFLKYNLEEHGLTQELFFEKYMVVNDDMWRKFNVGQMTKETIRKERFERTFKLLNIDYNLIPITINDDFLNICPSMGILHPFVKETLEFLSPKYEMHILTNGFAESQHIKLTTSGIDHYFNHVINSESCGLCKPNPGFFDHALNTIKAKTSECIMIGDDLEADILGAKNVGIDHVYFNWRKLKHEENLFHEIECLSELRKLL